MTNQAILSLLNYLCNEARNSVHATLGLMEMAPGMSADSAWRSCLLNSKGSAERLLRSIDDLRELLSAETPVDEVPEEFDFTLCLGETVALLNLAAYGQGTSLALESPGHPLFGRQHRRGLEQALTRILDSALKLCQKGEVRVSAAAAPGGAGVLFGIMPPDPATAVQLVDWLNADLEEMSFQNSGDVVFSVAAMVAGRRVRALGGTARFGCGSEAVPGLEISLPLWIDDIRNEEPAQSSQPDPGLSILVAEDCDESYALSAILLRTESVWRARNGREAIDMVKKHRFDLVLMDVHMPGLDGYSAIRAIRDWETQAGNARTPIVVLSSDDLDTQMRSAAQSGCSGYLRKPMRRRDLLDLLDRVKAARSLEYLPVS